MLSSAACTFGPDYAPRSASELAVPAGWQGATVGEAADITAWWTGFGDPVLTSLVERALSGNPDLAQSFARVAQARESLAQTRGSTLPQLDATERSGRNLNSDLPDTSSFARSIDARWTVDLFGGQRRSVEAARASYEAAGFTLANAQALLAAEVANTYIDLKTTRDRLTVAQSSMAVQRQNEQIAGWRGQAGLVSSIDVAQARAQRAQTAASVPPLEQAEAQARYRLAVLTGEAPGALDALLAGTAALPDVSDPIAAGAPSDLLRRRPDILAAERDLAAATARIGVAQAELYPALTLTGSVGTSAASLGDLFDVITGSLFATVAQVIFDGGQRKAAVRSQQAAAEGAFAVYRSTILGALEDVESALVARSRAEARIIALTEQEAASRDAALLARTNYRAGLTDLRVLLDAERSLLAAEDGLASARGDRVSAVIQLYLALGGGWAADGADLQAKR
ncbi:MAG: efflux transporter outer membrane subunit [Sphingopyxis sp.]|nr:efflux transporter outer membrane subunit [Sphingopyxis sp.]